MASSLDVYRTVQCNVPYQARHILVIVLDDVGIEFLTSYAPHTATISGGYTAPDTSNLAGIATAGVLGRWAYAQPACSPWRAGLHTGRYSHRNGTGTIVTDARRSSSYSGFNNPLVNGVAVPSRLEVTLPTILRQNGYRTGCFGKWHLSLLPSDASIEHGTLADGSDANRFDSQGAGWNGPSNAGWDDWWVTWSNLDKDPAQPYSGNNADGTYGVASPAIGGHTPNGGYYARSKNDTTSTLYNGAASYQPIEQRTRVIDWFNTNAPKGPVMAYVPMHLCHTPFHDPRAAGYSLSAAIDTEMTDHPTSAFSYFASMLEVADQEVGAILAGIDAEILANTMIIVTSDNGTPSPVLKHARDVNGFTLPSQYATIVDDAANRLKGSVYELGTRVPLFVQGPEIRGAGRTIQVLIDTHVDVHETVRHISHNPKVTDGRTRDGVSFLPPMWTSNTGRKLHARQESFCHIFTPNGTYANADVATTEDQVALTMYLNAADGWSPGGYYRLIRDVVAGTEEFYQKWTDAGGGLLDARYELTPLALSGVEYDHVKARMDAILASA